MAEGIFPLPELRMSKIITQGLEAQNIVGRNLIPGSSGRTMSRRNPSNGEIVSSFFESSNDDVRSAVESARKAFENSNWSTDPKTRSIVLRKISSVIQDNFEELCQVQSLESGKLINDSRIQLRTTIDLFEYYSGLARMVSGRTALPEPNALSFILREPIGVVAIIVPWNSPLILLARSLAHALAAGNTVLIKPSSYTPASVFLSIKKIVKNVLELPEGVLNLVQGGAKSVGTVITKHVDIDMISLPEVPSPQRR